MTTWTTIDSSPAVEAVREALSALHDIDGFPDEINLVDYIDGITMPLENIYTELRSRGVPPSRFFGEHFARRIHKTLFDIYNGRNRKSGLDAFAAAARFDYLIRWFDKLDTSGTPNNEGDYPTFAPAVNYDLCVTPIPEVVPNQQYVEEVSAWVKWLVPHFPQSTVSLCTYDIIDFEMHTHYGIVDFQEVLVR